LFDESEGVLKKADIYVVICIFILFPEISPEEYLSSLARIEHFEKILYYPEDIQNHQYSSHDRSGANDDGFVDICSPLYIDTSNEYLLLTTLERNASIAS